MTGEDRHVVARAKAFSTEPVREYRFSVDRDGGVRVYDDVAGHYTLLSALSPRSEERIRRLAGFRRSDREPHRRVQARSSVIDEHAATELSLYINNDGSLYERLKAPIWRRLSNFKEKGAYDHQRAVAAFKYLVEAGAKQYAREFGTSSTLPWNRMFAVATRDLVAKELASAFEAEWDVTHAQLKSSAEVRRDVDASLPPRKRSRRR